MSKQYTELNFEMEPPGIEDTRQCPHLVSGYDGSMVSRNGGGRAHAHTRAWPRSGQIGGGPAPASGWRGPPLGACPVLCPAPQTTAPAAARRRRVSIAELRARRGRLTAARCNTKGQHVARRFTSIALGRRPLRRNRRLPVVGADGIRRTGGQVPELIHLPTVRRVTRGDKVFDLARRGDRPIGLAPDNAVERCGARGRSLSTNCTVFWRGAALQFSDRKGRPCRQSRVFT